MGRHLVHLTSSVQHLIFEVELELGHMTIRARFSPDTRDVVSTIAWLNESGVAEVETWQQVYDLGIVEIQMTIVPPVLAYLSQVDDSLSISRITEHGVVFYLTDVPLTVGVPPERLGVMS